MCRQNLRSAHIYAESTEVLSVELCLKISFWNPGAYRHKTVRHLVQCTVWPRNVSLEKKSTSWFMEKHIPYNSHRDFIQFSVCMELYGKKIFRYGNCVIRSFGQLGCSYFLSIHICMWKCMYISMKISYRCMCMRRLICMCIFMHVNMKASKHLCLHVSKKTTVWKYDILYLHAHMHVYKHLDMHEKMHCGISAMCFPIKVCICVFKYTPIKV